jgi:hypothetical protein
MKGGGNGRNPGLFEVRFEVTRSANVTQNEILHNVLFAACVSFAACVVKNFLL